MHLELNEIHKHFGPVHANAGITLTVHSGSIHGLLGENGAGKSTLMKVLSGYITADSGEIKFDGQRVHYSTPAAALRHGVGMLHQDPLDFPPFTLLDNFLLGRDNALRQRRAEAERDFSKLCQQFGFELDPHAYVSTLTVGERQQLEIVRLLWLGARTLILDEPTTGISVPQKVKLFATLKELAARGLSLIFVSHKLEDVEELCDEVTVLQKGKVTGRATKPFSAKQLVEMMFGQVLNFSRRPDVPLGETVLELRAATFDDGRLTVPNISLKVAAGEVIGLAGLEGSGQKQFLQGCTGLLPPTAGQLLIHGQDYARQPYQKFLAAGTAFVPADRITEGLIPGLTITEHMVLARRGKQPAFINWEAAQSAASQRIMEFNIRGAPATQVERLSGGNQQRTLLALLAERLQLIALEHPTRGLDVESAFYIWGKLLERRKQGAAIIFTSADLDEILQYSDRILVFFAGQVIETVSATTVTTEQLGYLIGGKKL